MSKGNRKVKCDWCAERWAPLKLSNMFVDRDYEVKVVCSHCIIRTSSRDLFGDEGPIPWPQRFIRDAREVKIKSPRWAKALTWGAVVGFFITGLLSLLN